MRSAFWVPLLVFVLVEPASANPLGIRILDDQFTTNVGLRLTRFVGDGTETTTTFRPTTSGSGLSDSLQASVRVFATATAETFSVATRTSALPNLAMNEVSAFTDCVSLK